MDFLSLRNLTVIDLATKLVNIHHPEENLKADQIPFDDEEQAVIHYDSLERLTRGDPVKSVVLVKSQNLSELKKAYPNYFLDAALFVDTITGIIKQEVPKSG